MCLNLQLPYFFLCCTEFYEWVWPTLCISHIQPLYGRNSMVDENRVIEPPLKNYKSFWFLYHMGGQLVATCSKDVDLKDFGCRSFNCWGRLLHSTNLFSWLEVCINTSLIQTMLCPCVCRCDVWVGVPVRRHHEHRWHHRGTQGKCREGHPPHPHPGWSDDQGQLWGQSPSTLGFVYFKAFVVMYILRTVYIFTHGMTMLCLPDHVVTCSPAHVHVNMTACVLDTYRCW